MLNLRGSQAVRGTSTASYPKDGHRALLSQPQLCGKPSACRGHSTVAHAAVTMRSTLARSPSASSAFLIQLKEHRLQIGVGACPDRGFSSLQCRASRTSSEQLKSQPSEQYRLIAPTETTISTPSTSSSPLWMMGLAFFGITALISTLILQQRERRQAVKESPGEDASAPAPVSAPGSYQRALAKNRQVSQLETIVSLQTTMLSSFSMQRSILSAETSFRTGHFGDPHSFSKQGTLVHMPLL